jgi:hypothetical protein
MWQWWILFHVYPAHLWSTQQAMVPEPQGCTFTLLIHFMITSTPIKKTLICVSFSCAATASREDGEEAWMVSGAVVLGIVNGVMGEMAVSSSPAWVE